jgi:hypothetical protein
VILKKEGRRTRRKEKRKCNRNEDKTNIDMRSDERADAASVE